MRGSPTPPLPVKKHGMHRTARRALSRHSWIPPLFACSIHSQTMDLISVGLTNVNLKQTFPSFHTPVLRIAGELLYGRLISMSRARLTTGYAPAFEDLWTNFDRAPGILLPSKPFFTLEDEDLSLHGLLPHQLRLSARFHCRIGGTLEETEPRGQVSKPA
ncbi:hypothetical protein CYLTODRAFT_89495 [Cylindrobasidium torrendii FP15055 ss-10]|uniref:Uncharacterized protein n=1 Tax=Cylindrobasidium torrendii FP15055 ss-10 TaxID=1314674 RepID=A0A0D7B1V4_9AGAR|nr:hypothetical protein CYLTODRAFT_89495 [Cylindrobasidium torrendii FP15055 ss-10]